MKWIGNKRKRRTDFEINKEIIHCINRNCNNSTICAVIGINYAKMKKHAEWLINHYYIEKIPVIQDKKKRRYDNPQYKLTPFGTNILDLLDWRPWKAEFQLGDLTEVLV